MLRSSENGRRSARRLALNAPQLTFLSLALGALVLVLTIGTLGFGASRQARLASTAEEISDSSRLVVQLQRETLRLLTLVREDPDTLDPDAASLQRSLLESRFNIASGEAVRSLIPPEIDAQLKDIEATWADMQPLLDEWEANPDDEALQAETAQALADMEFQMNATEINYARLRARAVNALYRTSQRWFLVLGGVSLLIVMFLSAVAISIYRINQQRREAEAAQAAALEANRLKSEFLATMSHELRTPLNGVIGYADFLLEAMAGDFSPQQQDYLGRILSNGERLLRLVDDILDVSRIEAGRIELVDMAFSPAGLVEHIRPQMEALAEKRGLAFSVSVDPDLPAQMVGDGERLEQIIINLVNNAIKFTDSGKVDLKLAKRDSSHWAIVVQDTGIGIPVHAQEYIFEKFRQVDGSSDRKEGGAGLGLTIVRNLAVLMGGSVHLTSELGKGSTFSVELPIVIPQLQDVTL